MITGVGTDIIEIDRVRRELEHGDRRWEGTVFLRSEIAYCRQRHDPAPHLAGRWAAKEAVLKALGSGAAGGIGWTDIEITREESGRPGVILHGRAKELARSLGVRSTRISISHEKRYATAVAILEQE